MCGTNLTITATDLLRRIIWSNDEPTANVAATLDELETLVPLCCIFEAGYNDPNVEPIVLREGYGLAIVNVGNTAVGVCDCFIECTLAAS